MAPLLDLNRTTTGGSSSSNLGESSCHAPQTPRKPLPTNVSSNKSVKFNRIAKIHKVIHLKHYSDMEIANCWYTDDEFADIRETAIDAAEYLEHGMVTSEELSEGLFCSRGLEGLTRGGSLERRRNSDAGLDAVLDEQELQGDEGFDDPEHIAYLYKVASSRAEAKARASGLEDELFAMLS